MDCKKLTGATNLLMVLSARAAFSSRGDVVKYRKKADSGRELDICRCQTCGVRMWHEPLSAPNLIFVAAGTLDEPSWVIPTSHIYVERVSPGVEMAGDALQVNGQPPNREVLMEAFSKAYPDYR